MERFEPDPSRPYQRHAGFLATWLRRGRGRDDRAHGLLMTVRACNNPSCACTRAAVAAIPIDERLAWAKHGRRGIEMSWRGGHDREPASVHQLTLDFVEGSMTDARGGDLPRAIERFFREPIPSWVLDDVFAEWASLRPSPETPWFEGALDDWEPGVMLSAFAAFPTGRPDWYRRDGKAYVVDFVFCVQPGCSCTANRFVLLEVEHPDDRTQQWTQIGSVELDAELAPRDYDGAPERRDTLIGVYVDWRARSGNPRARFDELRARTIERGAELRARWEERERTRAPRVAAPAVALGSAAVLDRMTAGKPGRNDLCPCGSGKKYKHCHAG